MKKLTLLIAAMLILFSVQAQTQTQPNWESLFNGRNLNGWTKLGGTAQYKVVDGVIVGVSAINTDNTFLATKKEYADFVLELSFKVEDRLNSGIQFRSHSIKSYQNGRVHGYQYEIDPSSRGWSAGIYDEARRGWLYDMDLNPAAKTALKLGEWNETRIVAHGNNIDTYLNGIHVSSIIDDVDSKGFIALQVHGIGNNKELEGTTVMWKDIRIATEFDRSDFVAVNKCCEECCEGCCNECCEGCCNECCEECCEGCCAAIHQENCIDNTLSALESARGWKLLWDGKTTEGWRGARLSNFPQSGWIIRDGKLCVSKSDGGESTNGGDIVTTQKYGNFDLSVDFYISEGANSGIKYFVDTELNKGEGSSIGCEFQLLDDGRHPDAKMGVMGNRTLGSLYDLIAAPSDKPFKWGRFNRALIKVRDNHVEHWLNGVKLLEYERNTDMWQGLVNFSKFKDWSGFGNAAQGHILLQDHGDEVHFRNIKIREY